MKTAWGRDYTGYLDYVTGWHAQTIKLFHDRLGEFAYVTTNSIVQGQPVPALFEPLYREGWDIKFAHRTFSWDSEAPGKAAVHCVVVGFMRTPVVPRYTDDLKAPEVVRQRLWDYVNLDSHPIESTLTSGINAYLADGPRVLVTATRSPLSTELLPVHYGSKPSDGGNLVFKANDGTKGLDQDPIALKYLRRFVGAKEMLHNVERWCLWLPNADPADFRKSTSLQHYLGAVKKFREESTKKATQRAASTPSLFTEVRQPDVPYLCIPRHVSETRRYWTAARYSPDIICGDANFLAPDEDGLLFALISSSMFITWQRAVGAGSSLICVFLTLLPETLSRFLSWKALVSNQLPKPAPWY